MCFRNNNYTATCISNKNEIKIIRHNPPNEKGLDKEIFNGVVRDKYELKKILIELKIINE